MWGTLQAPPSQQLTQRFIPTHVGNTQTKSSARRLLTVHPHACGEHIIFVPVLNFVHGSSPRMWGTRIQYWEPEEIDRFIPTHVGNTLRLPPVSHSRSVHPHACGEHAIFKNHRRLNRGSSPRMWGTPSKDIPSRRP